MFRLTTLKTELVKIEELYKNRKVKRTCGVGVKGIEVFGEDKEMFSDYENFVSSIGAPEYLHLEELEGFDEI